MQDERREAGEAVQGAGRPKRGQSENQQLLHGDADNALVRQGQESW